MKIPEILIIESAHKPGSLGKILTVIGEAGIVVEHLNAIRRDQDQTIWEMTLEMDPATDYGVIDQINALPNAKILGRFVRYARLTGRSHHLRFVPRVRRNLEKALAGKVLADVKLWYERLAPPAVRP